jgi:hypothetical protein
VVGAGLGLVGAGRGYSISKFHDQGDAKWIVIRGQLRGHNNTPIGRPTPGRPIGRPGVGCPMGVFGGFSYYQLVMLFFNIVPLIMESTYPKLIFDTFCVTVDQVWDGTMKVERQRATEKTFRPVWPGGQARTGRGIHGLP